MSHLKVKDLIKKLKQCDPLEHVEGKYIAVIHRYLAVDIDICSTCATEFAKFWKPDLDQNKKKVDGRFLC